MEKKVQRADGYIQACDCGVRSGCSFGGGRRRSLFVSSFLKAFNEIEIICTRQPKLVSIVHNLKGCLVPNQYRL
jgi:hypothetical protein